MGQRFRKAEFLGKMGLDSISSEPGTYALVLRASRGGVARVGRLGPLTVRRGFYVYIGSAFGPGGLRARVRHHLRPARRPHWHLDYLRQVVRISEVWHSRDSENREHLWAALLGQTAGCSVPARRFGASDCQCESHLFFFESRPSVDAFRRCLHEAVRNPSAVRREKD